VDCAKGTYGTRLRGLLDNTLRAWAELGTFTLQGPEAQEAKELETKQGEENLLTIIVDGQHHQTVTVAQLTAPAKFQEYTVNSGWIAGALFVFDDDSKYNELEGAEEITNDHGVVDVSAARDKFKTMMGTNCTVRCSVAVFVTRGRVDEYELARVIAGSYLEANGDTTLKPPKTNKPKVPNEQGAQNNGNKKAQNKT
jgi:hypothetical protein